MGAQGFVTLARHFPDRTVVTFDPRGAERSRRTTRATESTPDEHADDLHRLISALDTGPVDIFATSGGAVNALALVARHPEQVRTLVAHEPPTAQVLPDREQVLAACVDIHETYLRTGLGPAMAKFITLVSYEGPLPADYAEARTRSSDIRAPDRGRRSRDTLSSGRTCPQATRTSLISTPSAPRRPVSSSPSERKVRGRRLAGQRRRSRSGPGRRR